PTSASSSGMQVWITRDLSFQDTPQDIRVTLATLSLPAGTFFLNAHLNAVNTGITGDETMELSARYEPGSGEPSSSAGAQADERGQEQNLSLIDVVSLAAPT